jgi:hypothetical protein
MMDDAARCAGPGCGRALDRAATGRRALYCGQNCRQAARRARARAEEEAAARAARLAEAKATASRVWRPLEEAGFRTVADLAALVLATAADHERPRAEMDQAVDDMLTPPGSSPPLPASTGPRPTSPASPVRDTAAVPGPSRT